jgi:hypothetical protein
MALVKDGKQAVDSAKNLTLVHTGYNVSTGP